MQQKLRFGTMLAFALKGTPIWRLIVTIILCTLAFGMLGVFQSFVALDLNELIVRGYCNEPVIACFPCEEKVLGHFVIENPNDPEDIYEGESIAYMVDEDIFADLEEKDLAYAYRVEGYSFEGLYCGDREITLDEVTGVRDIEVFKDMLKTPSLYQFALVASDAFMERSGYDVYGRMPQSKYEIALPYCLYEVLQLALEGEDCQPQTPEDLFDFTFRASSRGKNHATGSNERFELKIVGVVNTHCMHTEENGLAENVQRKDNLCVPFITEELARDQALVEIWGNNEDGSLNTSVGYFVDFLSVSASFDETEGSFLVTLESEEDLENLREIFRKYADRADLRSYSASEVLTAGKTLDEANRYVTIVVVVLSVVAVATLFLFMNATFAKKQRSLGLLQAMGADKKTIFLLFLTQALTVWAISAVLATVLAVVAFEILNGVLPVYFSIRVFRLQFGFSTFVLMYGLGLLTAVLGAAIPIRRAAKKTTVELLTEMEGN